MLQFAGRGGARSLAKLSQTVVEVAEARGHDQPGLGSGLLCSALLAMCEAAQALFMHEVPVHVNATMEEEVGQADDRRSSCHVVRLWRA